MTINFRKVLCLGWLALCAATAGSAGEPPCAPPFLFPAIYPVYASSQPIAVEDLNDDGQLDTVLLVNWPTTGIAVRLGQPDGTFGQTLFSPTTYYPWSMVVGRFAAGEPPAIVVSTQQGELYYHAGHGDGTFAAGVQVAPRFLYIVPPADVNGDDELDIVGVLPSLLGFGVHLGNGNGTFQPAIDTAADSYLGSLAVGDVDGDTVADVVAGTSDVALLVFRGLDNGSFEPPIEIPGPSAGNVALADFDGDSALDVAASTGGDFTVFRNNGDGTFQAGAVYDAGGIFALGDFNGDGALDVAAQRESVLRILLNTGDGLFVAGGDFFGSAGFAADLDGDGNVDLVSSIPSQQFSGLAVTRGNGDGTFQAPRLTTTDIDRSFPAEAVSGDFDEDGLPDLALWEGPLTIYLAAGSGAFRSGQRYETTGREMVSAQLDDDSHLDLALWGLEEVTIFHGIGDGTFVADTATPLPSSNYPYGVAAGDFDGDGVPDLAGAYRVGNEGGAILVLHGEGGGLFTPAETLPLPAAPSALAAVDLRGIGRSDLAAAVLSESASLQVLLSHAGGGFESPAGYDAGPYPTSVVAGNFSQNGRQDLMVGGVSDGTLAWLPSRGDGTFDDAAILSTGSHSGSLAPADFDQDGRVDLAMAGTPAAIMYASPDGGFGAPTQFPGFGGSTVFAGDFDGNGFSDLVFVDLPFYPFYERIGALLSGGLGVHVPDASAVVDSVATLEAYAGGFGALTYQWRKGGVPLADGGAISGSQTATLTIDPVAFADAGSYDVVVTDSCGAVTSNTAALAVEFADVPTSSPFHDDILAIATAAITGGCGGGNYCPASPVRRDQMAAFLLRAQHGSGYSPPPCSSLFDDVLCPGPFADWIEQLAAEGVTGGCGTDVYCPSQPVTRAQMAVFLLKTSEGSAYTPPPATGIFGDVPVGSFAADFIEDLYNRGISGGCSASPLLYCPNTAVLRQQMATFLLRTF